MFYNVSCLNNNKTKDYLCLEKDYEKLYCLFFDGFISAFCSGK